MSPSSMFVSIAAKSPDFSIMGAAVVLMFAPISTEIRLAMVVFPKPGGPKKRMWSSASALFLLASIKTFRFFFM